MILKKLSSKATPLELLDELDELEELEEDELEEDELEEDELDEDEFEELDVLDDVEELDDDDEDAAPDELDELEELLDELLLELEDGVAGFGSDLESLHAEIMARQVARHAVRLHLKKTERAGPVLSRLNMHFMQTLLS